MKCLSCLVALALITSTSTGQAMDAKATHLHSSAAVPRNARVPYATYRLRLHVEGTPLTQLVITLPEQFKVKQGVEITDQVDQTVSVTTLYSRNTITINFAQPVAPDTLLRVDLNGVSTSDYFGRTWLLPISGKSIGMTASIPIGTAQIQTY